jgi:hypothetical protein
MVRLGGRVLLASALFAAWACATATDSELGGSPVEPSSAGKGGHSGAGGTMLAKGGSGGSSASSSGGTTSGRGGTGTGGSSTAGSGTGGAKGGTGNTAGNEASGGTSTGGNAGDDGVPPEVLARAKVVLRHIARNASSTSSAVEAKLFFENKSDDALDLSHVKVRYWTTLEGTWGNLKCYYSALGDESDVTLQYVADGDESHVVIGFKAGTVPAHNAAPFGTTEFQMKVDAQNGATFIQSNDWSFDALTADDPPEPNDKITVYLANELVWGCEPSGDCAGEGGAGGQGGQGGEAGAETGGTGPGGQGGEPSSGQGGV